MLGMIALIEQTNDETQSRWGTEGQGDRQDPHNYRPLYPTLLLWSFCHCGRYFSSPQPARPNFKVERPTDQVAAISIPPLCHISFNIHSKRLSNSRVYTRLRWRVDGEGILHIYLRRCIDLRLHGVDELVSSRRDRVAAKGRCYNTTWHESPDEY